MLKGKNAIVTGASRGIGKAIAVKFAEQGAFVGINYYSNDKKAEETLKLVRQKKGNGMLLKGDISNTKDVSNVIDNFIEKRKNIDILVNNAGIYFRGSGPLYHNLPVFLVSLKV